MNEFFWVIPRRLNCICRRFGTLCLFHLHRQLGMKNSSYLLAYEEGTDCSETSEYKIQTPGNYPEESIQHSEQDESMKSRINIFPFIIVCLSDYVGFFTILLCEINDKYNIFRTFYQSIKLNVSKEWQFHPTVDIFQVKQLLIIFGCSYMFSITHKFHVRNFLSSIIFSSPVRCQLWNFLYVFTKFTNT